MTSDGCSLGKVHGAALAGDMAPRHRSGIVSLTSVRNRERVARDWRGGGTERKQREMNGLNRRREKSYKIQGKLY